MDQTDRSGERRGDFWRAVGSVGAQHGALGDADEAGLLAAALGIPRARVEGVAGFYIFLYTRPVGRYRVLFSDNITDRNNYIVSVLGGDR